MEKIKTIFFGTHEFAATILKGLIESPLFDIALVITQPDRPVGRKQEFQASPVKRLAQKYNLQINQPQSLRNYTLNAIRYTLGITAQYGLLIPKHIFDAPKYGTLNVHTSLLPKYRGASPIQTAIMNGDTETGVTIMRLDEGLDTGPILLQKKCAIGADDMFLDLEKKMEILGIVALQESVPAYIDGTIKPMPQDNTRAIMCRELTRDDGRINWQKTNGEIYNQWRALTPWPGIWTTWNGKRLKLLRVVPTTTSVPMGVVKKLENTIVVGCGTGALRIEELQLEGSKSASTLDFFNGHPNILGEQLQ